MSTDKPPRPPVISHIISAFAWSSLHPDDVREDVEKYRTDRADDPGLVRSKLIAKVEEYSDRWGVFRQGAPLPATMGRDFVDDWLELALCLLAFESPETLEKVLDHQTIYI